MNSAMHLSRHTITAQTTRIHTTPKPKTKDSLAIIGKQTEIQQFQLILKKTHQNAALESKIQKNVRIVVPRDRGTVAAQSQHSRITVAVGGIHTQLQKSIWKR